MAVHKVVIEGYGWVQGGHRGVESYHLDPPLPEDPFTYVIVSPSHERGQVITSEPYITESTAELTVPLVTSVFMEMVSRDRYYGPGSRRISPSAKQIRVTARVRVLRYGGSMFLYGGLIDQNPPRELPLEVLEWKIVFEYGKVRYESGRDGYRKIVICEIGSAPSVYDVCHAEFKEWPREPHLNTNLEQFFFQRWLKDRSLTLEDTMPVYEAEIITPHRQAMAQYEAELAECERFYQKWLERNGVLLSTPEEIWEYLRDEALPMAAQAVCERAQQVLEDAGHIEFLDLT